jgi:hypothetical protein
MTVQEAKCEMQRPLVFGDTRQIQARDVFREIADCAEAIRACVKPHGKEGAAVCRCTKKWRDRPDIIAEAKGK